MEIELTRGFKAVIDDDDFELIRGFKWRAHSSRTYIYAAGRAPGIACMLMHRLITGAENGMYVDHIDHDTLNNRRSNLRVCSASENGCNRKVFAHSRSQIRNVWQEKDSRGYLRWRADVRFSGKRVRRWFNSSEEAKKWADSVRFNLHGEFAYKEDQDRR